MENILVSVIVPIYNVKEYLEQCLDSICNQTYNNLQIILVDDGSTDCSLKICQKYAELDNRIKIIHKENGGLVSARKAGLKVAKGDYISFIDGDDWIDIDMFENLLNLFSDKTPDIISFGAIEEYGGYSKKITNNISEGLYISESIDDLKKNIPMGSCFFRWNILPHLCDKLFKHNIIKKILPNAYETIVFGEDVATTFSCISISDSLVSVNYCPYHYRQRQGSIVKSDFEYNDDNFIDVYKTLKNVLTPQQLKFYMFFIILLKKYSKINSKMSLFPFEKVMEEDKVFVYGAGGFGKVIYNAVKNNDRLHLLGWTDKNYSYYKEFGYDIDEYDKLMNTNFDYILISILNEKVADEVRKELISMGVSEEKILSVNKYTILESDFPDWLKE